MRRLNPRRVKIHRCYTVEEVAKLFGAHKNTVRGWLKAGLPRIFELEAEYEESQLAAELKFVKALVKDMDEGTLEGLDMWRVFHSEGFNPEEVHFEFNLDETPE